MPDDRESNSGSQSPSSQDICSNFDEGVARRRAVMFEAVNKIPVFSGQDPTWSWANFRESFTRWADFLKWPQEDRLFGVVQCLVGTARQTFLNFESQITSVEDLFRIFSTKYGAEKENGDFVMEFWQFQQAADMSVAEYIAKAKAKVKLAMKTSHIPESAWEVTCNEWLLLLMSKNLLPHIKGEIILREPSNMQELERLAILKEKAWKATGSVRETPYQNSEFACAITRGFSDNVFRSQSPQRDAFTDFTREMTAQITKLTERMEKFEANTAENVNKREPVCFECGSPNHFVRNCPQRRATRRRKDYGNYRAGENWRKKQDSGDRESDFRRGGEKSVRFHSESESSGRSWRGEGQVSNRNYGQMSRDRNLN